MEMPETYPSQRLIADSYGSFCGCVALDSERHRELHRYQLCMRG